MKKTVIFGLGKSGFAVADRLQKDHVPFFGIDKKEIACNFHVKLDTKLIDFQEVDRIIVSPGISLSHPLIQQAKQYPIKIMGEAEFGMQMICKPCLAITGTNGKTTVTEMVTHVLNSVGKKAEALGNIGHPISSSTGSKIAVIELSSYQLETLQQKKIDAALILNITPDHLDRYQTMEEYARAKIRIEQCLTKEGTLFVQDDVYEKYNKFFKSSPQILKSKGFSHEIFNRQAAFSLCRVFGVTKEAFDFALKSYQKPPHRIEFVRERQGVNYYNDSKGTNVQATIVAVQEMSGPVYLIAGGVDKESCFVLWRKVFEQKVKMLFTIGEAAHKIEQELRGVVEICNMRNLKEAVLAASELATKGENVLLSPGCSSFDQFTDYVDRGNQFKALVRELS